MNKIKPDKEGVVLSMLVEGTSIRSIGRITGIDKNTVMRVLLRAGERCQKILDANMRNLHCNSIECDEIWTFVGKKQKKLQPHEKGNGLGDQYVFVALDRDTKLVPVFMVGNRDGFTAFWFMQQLRRRIVNTFQLTTDKFTGYREAVPAAFGNGIHYAMLQKQYHGDGSGREGYSPSALKGVIISTIIGKPERKRICTSYVERNNLTMRMHLRRFARLTNAFSKKVENLKAALALHFYYYNFVKVHQTLRMTPAMKAGLTSRVWSWAEIIS